MASDRDAQMLLAAARAGITSPKELANFMAQVSHESNDLTRLDEGFRYTKGNSQITSKVRSALREGPEALEAARLEALRGEPERLAELMYGGRMGNASPGDGWKYHGRGYIQLTGKEGYEKAGKALGLDLVNHPDLAAEPENAAKIAIHYWKSQVPKSAREDVTAATQAINGGNNGSDDRKSRFAQWKQVLTPEVMAGLARGEVLLPVRPAQHSSNDSTVKGIQQNLNHLGIPGAEGRPLVVDGLRGGPKSNTNEAIAAFQQKFGLTGELSNAQLLMATQVALNADPMRSFDHAMGKVLPLHKEPAPPHMVGGVPDYLRSGHGPPRQTAHAPSTPQPVAPATAHHSAPASFVPPDLDDATVKTLQQNLNRLDVKDAHGRSLAVDGDYGFNTRDAVAAFQREQWLPVTGLADNSTLSAVSAHVVVAELRQHKAERAEAQFHAKMPAYDARPFAQVEPAPPVRLDPLGRETATWHDSQHPGVSGPDALRATYAPAMRDVAATSEMASPSLRRAADAPDHSALGQQPMASPGLATELPPALRPFSDARHPQHALYEDVRDRLAAKGQHFPEDRMNQITAALHNANFKAGWDGRIDVKDDKVYAQNYQSFTHSGVIVPLDKPAPSIQAAMEDVQHQDHLKAQQREAFAQQHQQVREQGSQGHVMRRGG